MKLLCIGIFLLICSAIFAEDIYISEIAASGSATISDKTGDHTDWFELYNTSDTTINLIGYSLSDSKSNLHKFTFSDKNLDANSTVLVYANAKAIAPRLNEHYADFKLNSKGECLFLTHPNNEIIDSICFPSMKFNTTYGRTPNEKSDQWQIFELPTPNKPNTTGTIEPSHRSGFYATPISLTFDSNDTIEIRYTLDGSIPTAKSALYSAPIELKGSTNNILSQIPTTPLEGNEKWIWNKWTEPSQEYETASIIRYMGFFDDKPVSRIYSNTYFFDPELSDLQSFPIISIITEQENLFDYSKGIYVPGEYFEKNEWSGYWPPGNYQRDWDREINFEYFDTDGLSHINAIAEVTMVGKSSVTYAQKSMKVKFSADLGTKKFEYPLFGTSSLKGYKDVQLKNSGNDFVHTHFADAFMQSLLSDVDVETLNFAPSHVYINGEYWGIHNMREAYGTDYFETHFDVEQEDLIIVEGNSKKVRGSSSSYKALISFAKDNDLSLSAHYDSIAKLMDIDNYIDYNIAEIYFANYDWPGNNYKAWKTTDPNSKWRWLLFDLDLSFGYNSNSSYDVNSLNHATIPDSAGWPTPEWSTVLLRALLENNNFKTKFIDQFEFHLKNTFESHKVIARIEEFTALYDDQIQHQIDRWNWPTDYDTWLSEIDKLRQFAAYRPCAMKDHLIEYFGLDSFDFDCEFVGVDQISSAISIYPNPAKDHCTIVTDEQILELTLFDVYGNKIIRPDIYSEITHTMDITNISRGLYIVCVKTPTETASVLVEIE